MNLNYVGSVAERFMKFRSSLASTEEVELNLFNAISIYVPKSLASDNIVQSVTDVTATKYAVIEATVDNYKEVFKSTGSLLAQWSAVFNDGVNKDVTLYVIVFDDTSFDPTVTASGIEWAPLTKAFNELYFISCFKTMFDTDYTGKTSSSVNNYPDLALCLSALCANESTLSVDLLEVKVTVPATRETTDSNAVKVLSHTRAEEIAGSADLENSEAEDRAEYLWGFVNKLGGSHTWFIVHNDTYMFPIVLATFFSAKNSSGEFIGNKLAKVRLTGSKVAPTGLPSNVNADVICNLDSKWYENLDAKSVGYFISIADSTLNNAELSKDRTVENFPVTAYLMSKWIDYTCAQTIAKYATSRDSLTEPVLANEDTYNYIQRLVQGTVNTFASTGRITDVTINFPPFAEAKKGQRFEGTAVWSAVYVDDFEGVDISGSITF